MNAGFIISQIIGIIAWLILALSYHRKNTDKILLIQILGNVLFCLHYFLLGAYSGFFACLFETVFDLGYYKTDKDKYIYLISVPVRIFGGVITYQSPRDVLPIAASLIDGYSLTKKKKVVVFGAVISYLLWVIYDICVLSFSGALTDGLVVVNNLGIILFQYKTLKENK